eukprot:77968-Alexandrium_andersonii.AAC.1
MRNVVISDEEAQRLQEIFGRAETSPKGAAAGKAALSAAEGGGSTPTAKESTGKGSAEPMGSKPASPDERGAPAAGGKEGAV